MNVSDVQRENGSGRGPGPRPAIGYATDGPLSTSTPGRGVDVVMDCRRRPPESPDGCMNSSRRRRVLRSAVRHVHRALMWPCTSEVSLLGCEASRRSSCIQSVTAGNERFLPLLSDILTARACIHARLLHPRSRLLAHVGGYVRDSGRASQS